MKANTKTILSVNNASKKIRHVGRPMLMALWFCFQHAKLLEGVFIVMTSIETAKNSCGKGDQKIWKRAKRKP